ncbi:MAG: hypothetical protein JWM52_590 [Candidatus Saccharibacteria bacterium]|nr:hypothetical protein [Candidatus Saccharibacteria bacterium]
MSLLEIARTIRRVVMEIPNLKTIDQKEINQLVPKVTQRMPQQSVAALALELAGLSMEFARIERVPRYSDGRYESDVEHSYMLSMVGSELAYLLYPDLLDPSLVHEYGSVHDLVELKTKDTATFNISDDDLCAKETAEAAAREEVASRLPPYLAKRFRDYESQIDLESRFVKAVDKLLPVLVDILGDGITMLTKDYNVSTIDQLHEIHVRLCERIGRQYATFPDIVSAHALLTELFEEEATMYLPASA